MQKLGAANWGCNRICSHQQEERNVFVCTLHLGNCKTCSLVLLFRDLEGNQARKLAAVWLVLFFHRLLDYLDLFVLYRKRRRGALVQLSQRALVVRVQHYAEHRVVIVIVVISFTQLGPPQRQLLVFKIALPAVVSIYTTFQEDRRFPLAHPFAPVQLDTFVENSLSDFGELKQVDDLALSLSLQLEEGRQVLA